MALSLLILRRGNGVFETIIGGLILAAISAMVFLAYSHPKQFSALAPYLLAALFVGWLSVASWWMALMSAKSVLLGAIKFSEYEKVSGAIEALMPNIWVVLLGPAICVVFFGILQLWVTKLKDEEGNKKGDGKKP